MFIVGKKVKMSQIWKDRRVIPVTLVEARPNRVSLVRTARRDGYSAVQLQLGRTKKEFRTPADPNVELGDAVDVTSFQEGDTVKVSGTSRGRGFAGVVKRHGFGGGPKTHGQKNRFRAPGSIGSTAPQRVTPGRRMAGHMGNVRVTVRNVTVAGVDAKKHLLMLKGAVPGAPGSLVEIRKVSK